MSDLSYCKFCGSPMVANLGAPCPKCAEPDTALDKALEVVWLAVCVALGFFAYYNGTDILCELWRAI